MQIAFEMDERQVLAGFLFQTRANSNEAEKYLKYEKNIGNLNEESFKQSLEKIKLMRKRIQKLINKFMTPCNAVKLKRRDVDEFILLVKNVVEDHENFEAKNEADKPVLTEDTYEICLRALEKLEDGMKRSKAQDR